MAPLKPRRDVLPPASEKRARVQSMFDRIAPRYDLLNRLISGGMDQRWRSQALDLVSVRPGDRLLDLACGTGDLCEQARRRGAWTVGADFSRQMLRGAQDREVETYFVQGDAACLPVASGSVSVVTCGFALRNFVSLEAVFAELARVLSPGGRVALIDVDRPDSTLVRVGHSLYFDRIVPWIGGLISDRDAYRYLPESTVYLPEASELLSMLAKAGFEAVAKRRLMLGAAQIITAVRTPAGGRAA